MYGASVDFQKRGANITLNKDWNLIGILFGSGTSNFLRLSSSTGKGKKKNKLACSYILTILALYL